jgi:hypothetical protein
MAIPPATVPALAAATATPFFTEEEAATLESLERMDEHPLYVMRYRGTYRGMDGPGGPPRLMGAITLPAPGTGRRAWGCSIFAALGDETEILYGRNADTYDGAGLLLFTDPPGGYASVSMVHLNWLALGGEPSRNLAEVPLADRKMLLYAPFVPFDGMNEKGLAIAVAAVESGGLMHPDPKKRSISLMGVMREVLDRAATVQEAIDIMGSYNINMAGAPVHYLVSSAAGESAILESYNGKLVATWNTSPWQAATNFIVAASGGKSEGGCWRYNLINFRLRESAGQVGTQDALRLLADVIQESTQWRALYHLTSGEIEIVMGNQVDGTVHKFRLDRTGNEGR